MRTISVAMLGVLAALAVGAAEAQTPVEFMVPAEIPPASFAGPQYVDSRGCVYIRVGTGQSVAWVPRLNQDRTQVCNARPTTVAAAPAPKPKAQAAPAPQVVVAAPVHLSEPRKSTRDVLVVRTGRTGRQFLGPSIPAEPVSTVPKLLPGYKIAWDDGRLNPYRPRTSALKNPRVLVMANTEPPRLIDSVTGEDVTALYPEVIYPLGKSPPPGVTLRGRTAGMGQAVRASSRSLPQAETKRSGRKGYVQVGTFRDQAGAQKALRVLRDAGLPFAKRFEDRGGNRYEVILAGPFYGREALKSGVVETRALGFETAAID